MIIRQLRADEKLKLKIVQSIAFNYSIDLKAETDEKIDSEVIGCFEDDGETLMASIYPNNYKFNYDGEYVGCSGIGGVATLPQYRRSGCIRAIFAEIFRLSPERGWAISYLYPFSYNYYRQFGYERIALQKDIRVGTEVLAQIPRDTNAVIYRGEENLTADLREVYHAYALKYNMMADRSERFPYLSDEPNKSGKYTYIHYDNANKPNAYATIYIENGSLTVSELAYTDSQALVAMLGFIRLYESQIGSYNFIHLPDESNLDYILKDYNNCSYSLYSRGMGRVVLVGDLLRKHKYPAHLKGAFKLKVNDVIDYNNKVFEVEYQDGVAQVTEWTNIDSDVEIEVPTLSRIMFGADNFTLESASYLPGVKVSNTDRFVDFLAAFPKRSIACTDYF